MNTTTRRFTGTIIGRRSAIALAALGLVAAAWSLVQNAAQSTVAPAPSVSTAPAIHPSFLHGRVTTVDGVAFEGRLRFGGDEEAFWSDYFNGFKAKNPWASLAPRSALRGVDTGRPIMVRFGDITKIEAKGRNLRVTLKSGTRYDLNRYAADDFADGLRIWDQSGNVISLSERRIRTIELFPASTIAASAPARLHGTVHTLQGDFTGFIQWNRREGVGLDELNGRVAAGAPIGIPFQTIRSIVRAGNGSRVTMLDGREVVLSGTSEVGAGNAGLYVDDARYGRVLVSWDVFARADFGEVGSSGDHAGPAYSDFSAGRVLTGNVTTRGGRSVAGRLVFDLDESQTTETLDAPAGGVDYTIPLGMVASIMLPASGSASGRALVTLRSGEQLRLARAGDLGVRNAGILVFVAGRDRPEYVSWGDVERLDFDRITPEEKSKESESD
jgi:hypothetical protein